VYHLFGRLEYPESLVLTEDDHIRLSHRDHEQQEANSRRGARPARVRVAVFLGFDLLDWEFRVLFRGLIESQEGVGGAERYAHLAAQTAPQEGVRSAAKARDFFEKSFVHSKHQPVLGIVDDFARAGSRRSGPTGSPKGDRAMSAPQLSGNRYVDSVLLAWRFGSTRSFPTTNSPYVGPRSVESARRCSAGTGKRGRFLICLSPSASSSSIRRRGPERPRCSRRG
jgi:hypothetical protein